MFQTLFVCSFLFYMSLVNSQGILRGKSGFHNEYESLLKLRHLESTLLHHQSQTLIQLNEMKNRLMKMEGQLRNGKSLYIHCCMCEHKT